MNTSKVVLFDIDGTLLDTNLMDPIVIERFAEILDQPSEVILELDTVYTRSLSSARSFNFNDYCNYYANRFAVNSADLLQVFYEKSTYLPCLPAELPNFLAKAANKSKLGIFSEGLKEFQMLKLQKTDILKYFDNTLLFLFEDKTVNRAIEQLPYNATIVDNSNHVLDSLVNYPLKSFKVIQYTKYGTDQNSLPIIKCKDLTSLLEVL